MTDLLVGASVHDMVGALIDAGAECVQLGYEDDGTSILYTVQDEERHATLVVGEMVNYREGQFAAVAYSDSGAKKLITAPTLDELAGLAVVFAAA